MNPHRAGWTRFGLAVCGYAVLVLVFGLPVLMADCGAGAIDIEAACTAAARSIRIYDCTAVAVLSLAAWAWWSGRKWAIPFLLLGSLIPITFALVSDGLLL